MRGWFLEQAVAWVENEERRGGNGSVDLRLVELYEGVGLMLEQFGKHDAALVEYYYGKALVIDEKTLGKDHPDTAQTYNNMANVFESKGEYEKALEYYGKALVIFQLRLGEDHPNTKNVEHNFSQLQLKAFQ